MTSEKEHLSRYLGLLRDFAERKLTGPEFEEKYLALFKNDPIRLTGREFLILDKVFSDVDEYVSDPELRQDVGGLDDEQLRSSAQHALNRLLELGY
jgi:hypothetical protein